MKRQNCPICGQLLVEPIGPVKATHLLIGEFPNYDDVRSGCVATGKVGDILRHELALAGIQLSVCRVINLWQHGKSKECDPAWHLDYILKEIEGHEWVLLMGSEITKALVNHGIMEVAGLQVKSKLFPKVKFFAIPNAGTLLRGDIGEMRLALEKFQKKTRKK
jgi:uracil-DNA glycosylase